MDAPRRLTGKQIVAIVVSICAAAVLVPVGAIAASTLVTMVDPVTGSKARVDAGKVRVGDGSGGLTVDTVNTVLYKSPAGGLNCGASSSGLKVATLNLAYYRAIRFAVQSGPSNQTIFDMRARAGDEVINVPWAEFTVPAGQYGHRVFYDPPAVSDLIIYFCGTAKIFVYGLR